MIDTMDSAEAPGVAPASGVDQAGATASGPGSARWDLASHLRLWLLAAAGLAADLWTKHWAFTQLDPDDGWTVLPSVMTFRRSLNSGALFGMGKGLTPVFIVASVLALGFVFYLFIHSQRERRSLHVALAFVLGGALGNLYDRAFVIADVVKYAVEGRTMTTVGIIARGPDGSVYQPNGSIRLLHYPEMKPLITIPPDWQPQVRQQGVVRDFIKMEPKTPWFDLWPWVFNIADSLLVVGVSLLMLNFWWDRRAELAAQAEVAPA